MFARLFAVPDALAAAYARHPLAWRWAFAVALLGVLGFTVARYAEKAVTPSRDGTLTRTALLRWRPQIQALERGENIYVAHNYPNPPVMAMILWPFTELPPVAGGVLWLLLKAGMAVLMALWAFRLCGPLPAPAKGLAVVLAAHPILGDLNHGNVNTFIAFLVLGCLELYRRGHDLAAGLALGLAIACKVTPALFVPYFGWKAVRAWLRFREGEAPAEPGGKRLGGSLALPNTRWPAFWRGGGTVLAGTAVGLFLFLFAVPAAVLAARTPGGMTNHLRAGWDENLTLLGSWFDVMVRPFLLDGRITSVHANQSIPGVVHRLLVHEPSDEEYDEESGKMRAKEYRNLADIGPDGAKWVVRGCQFGFVLLVVVLCRSAEREGLAVAAECGLIVLGMLLFSERTWKHHGTALVLPVAAVVGLWAGRPSGLKTKALVFAVLAAVTALTLVPSLLGGRAQDVALTFGTHTAAYLLLLAAVGVAIRLASRDREGAASSRSK